MFAVADVTVPTAPLLKTTLLSVGVGEKPLPTIVIVAALAGVAQERIPEQVDEWLGHLHAPTGLDLGAESPETVAISILAEIQKVLSRASARPLREVRAVRALPEATSTPTPTL